MKSWLLNALQKQILVLDDTWKQFFPAWGLIVNFIFPFLKKIILIIGIENGEIKHKTKAAGIVRGDLILWKCYRAYFCHWATKYLSKQITLTQFNKPLFLQHWG